MSATFTIKSNVKAVTAETRRRIGVALDKVAIDWHRDAVLAISGMVYNQPRGDYKRTNRLRSSLTFTSPNIYATHTFSHDEGTEAFNPPKSNELEAMVGTNVEYAAAVHDGLGGNVVNVKAHTRRIRQAFGRPITPRTINVQAHRKTMPPRIAKPFIEQPGIQLSAKVPGMITAELNR